MMEAEAGNDVEAQMLARCLGYLITELPREAGESVANEVNEVVGCNSDFQKMADLAHLYINYLIRLCESYYFAFNNQHHDVNSILINFFLVRQNKGHTPAPSEHPSRPSFKMRNDLFSEAVEPAPRDHLAAKKSVSMLSNSTTSILSYYFKGFKT